MAICRVLHLRAVNATQREVTRDSSAGKNLAVRHGGIPTKRRHFKLTQLILILTLLFLIITLATKLTNYLFRPMLTAQNALLFLPKTWVFL